ncbi:MAG: hypothetical protein QG553_75 [Patescibacteria group bacterium]|nr:hypothetical protein [Patescibacteria group bacterium]
MIKFRRAKPTPGRQERNPGQPKKPVFSYNTNQTIRASSQSREDNDQSRPRPAKTSSKAGSFWENNWVRNFPSLVALAAVTVSVLYCLGLTTNPKVVVSANSPQAIVLRDKVDYEVGAQKILSQSLLSRTKFTVNAGGFEKAFRAEFPEVDQVSLTLPLVSRRPIVTLSIAQPQLILTANSQAYVLDKRGTVIMPAKELSSTVRATLPVVNDQSGLEVATGKTVLPTEDIQFITEVVAQLKAKQIGIESITLPKVAQQVDIKIAGQPYYVKFSVNSQAREAVGTFLATKKKLEETKVTPSQYIDVRIPGRAYYL